MDVISFSEAATANGRIEIINANPDSSSGIVTVPKTIASGETVTIPAGRVAILPNVQVDGVLNVEGEVFIPSGATFGGVVEKVTSNDNAIVRFDGTTGAVQNSGVIINDTNHMGIGTSSVTERVTLPQGSDGRVGWSSGTATVGAIYMDSSDNVKIMGRNGAANSAIDRITLDPAGNVLVTGTGGLGYGTGSGGTVTQLTSKSTAVTLNKPSGNIIMNNAPLASGAEVSFSVLNSLVNGLDIPSAIAFNNANYSVRVHYIIGGSFNIAVKNNTAGTLSEALAINFNIIKGANS